MVIGSLSPSCLATRSILSSVSGSSPYPDLMSTVVTPSACRRRSLSVAESRSAMSEVSRVAFTVLRMPPPSRAICS